MKKLLGTVLAVSVGFVGGVVWLGSSLRAGAGGVASASGDVNGDGQVDVSDAVYTLLYLFKGGQPPVACADSGELAARVEALESSVADLGREVNAGKKLAVFTLRAYARPRLREGIPDRRFDLIFGEDPQGSPPRLLAGRLENGRFRFETTGPGLLQVKGSTGNTPMQVDLDGIDGLFLIGLNPDIPARTVDHVLPPGSHELAFWVYASDFEIARYGGLEEFQQHATYALSDFEITFIPFPSQP